MKNKINKWGNSHGIRLSAIMLEHLHAVDGDQLEMKLTKNGIEIIKNIKSSANLYKQKEKAINDMMQQTEPVQTVANPNIEGAVHYIIISVNPCKPIIRQVARGYKDAYGTLADAKHAARSLIQQSIEEAKKSLADIRQVGIEKIKYIKL